jgi:hypothetical protein
VLTSGRGCRHMHPAATAPVVGLPPSGVLPCLP